jgi:hypothetical protein
VTNPPPDGPAASGGSWLPGEETWGLGPQPEVPLAALELVTLKLSGSGAHRTIALSADCGELCYAFGTAHVIGPSGRSLMKKIFYGADARDGNLRIDWGLDLNAKARRRLAGGTRAFTVRLHMRFGDVWNRRVPRTYEVASKAFMSRSRGR